MKNIFSPILVLVPKQKLIIVLVLVLIPLQKLTLVLF